jgi:hypothetical protein
MVLAAMFLPLFCVVNGKNFGRLNMPFTSVYIPQSNPPSSLVSELAGDDCVPTLGIDDGDAITFFNDGSLTAILIN